MEFITTGNRIAVENFDKGKLYTVLWKNDTQENLMCISIGADCVVFQGEAPINLFTLSMRNADSIDSIEPTQLGTTNYNNLINKPQINGVDLIGNKTGAQLGLASQSDLEDYATNASVVAGLATKQDALSSSQLAAVNSGITSALVTQIGTNTSAIAGKQDALSSSQLAAVNSGITSEDVEQISTNKNNISSEQAKTVGMSEGGSNYITVSSMRLYMGDTEPTGTIPINSTWIYGSNVKSYQGGVGNNKFDEVYPDISSDIKYRAIYVGDGIYTLSSTVGRTTDPAAVLFFIAGNVSAGASSSGNGVWEGQYRTVTAVDGYVTIAYREMSNITPVNADTMLNTGASVDTYEPYEYGWV